MAQPTSKILDETYDNLTDLQKSTLCPGPPPKRVPDEIKTGEILNKKPKNMSAVLDRALADLLCYGDELSYTEAAVLYAIASVATYRVMHQKNDLGEIHVDIINVRDELIKMSELGAVGGVECLVNLVDKASPPRAYNVEEESIIHPGLAG